METAISNNLECIEVQEGALKIFIKKWLERFETFLTFLFSGSEMHKKIEAEKQKQLLRNYHLYTNL
tara:strand:- start:612 stop:809 length:198 start_codon:yes stop_codon:yes gene_type:complete